MLRLQMYAVRVVSLICWFGLPSTFSIFAPNDVDNELILRLATGVDDPESIDTAKRFSILSKNPVAAARIFERQIQAYFSISNNL